MSHLSLTWRQPQHGDGWLAYDEYGHEFVHVTPRSKDDIRRDGKDRYCVFGEALYPNYCGDLPIDMPEDEVKAAAAVMWRLAK